jgi:hypothetical protein
MTKVTKVEQETKEIIVSSNPYAAYGKQGFEDIKSTDLIIPYISLIQSGSPELEDKKIPNLEVGDLINSVTGEHHKGSVGINFIPCYVQELWVEWVPRLQGGGIVGQHAADSDVVKSAIAKNGGSKIPPKDDSGKRVGFKHGKNELVETYYIYGLLLDEEGENSNGFAVMTFSGTKISTYKKFITALMMLKGNPPIFANRATLKSTKQKNEYGSFFNYQISPWGSTWLNSLIDPNASLIEEAYEFRKMVTDGKAKADISNIQKEGQSYEVKEDEAF